MNMNQAAGGTGWKSWLKRAGIVLAILAIAFFLLKGCNQGPSPKVDLVASAAKSASAPSQAPKLETVEKKAFTVEMCTLFSDGHTVKLESLTALKLARDAYRKKGVTEAMLREAEQAAKPVPAKQVIAEVPVSMLENAQACDAWKEWRAYELVLGARKPTTPDVTVNGTKLMLSDVCYLHSDGTAIPAEALQAYKRAQDAFKVGKISEEKLREAEQAAKAVPAHELIDFIPESKLSKGSTCDTWRKEKQKKLVWGGPRHS